MITTKKIIYILTIFCIVSLSSCKKDKFDEPPHETPDPNLPVTHTIRQLKDLHTGTNFKITDSIIISGVVVANDKGGNFFDQIVIDDGTAGISIAIDQNALFGEFPVGRKIYVKCKNLVLFSDNKLLGLYGAIDLANEPVKIPSNLISKYIVKANTGNPVVPIEIKKISRLSDSFQNRLVKILEVEFIPADTAKPYADAPNKSSLNRGIRDCYDGDLIVRTSGYADFAPQLTPTGKGSLIGVYTVYNNDGQLLIRNTQDVNMNDNSKYDICPVIDTLLFENFQSTPGNGTLSLTGWVNINTAGAKKWTSTGSSNKNARFSAFSSDTSFQEASNIGWLITPPVNMNLFTNEVLTFRRSLGFVTGTIKMEILYSTNYAGSGSPNLATWTLLTDDVPFATTSFTNSSPISLNGITGTSVYFAFRYEGGYSPSVNTTQYNLDNILICTEP